MQKLIYSQDRVAEARYIRGCWYNGESIDRTPFVYTVNDGKNAPYNYAKMCADSKFAAESVLHALQRQLNAFPDCDFLPIIDVAYLGQGILAAIYGAKQYLVESAPPFTEGRLFDDIYEAAGLTNNFDMEKTEWCGILKEHILRLMDATGWRLPIGAPDYQSPYGTATKLLPNEDLMMAMYDEPELTRQFLDTITDGIIMLSDIIVKWVGEDKYAHNRSNPVPGK